MLGWLNVAALKEGTMRLANKIGIVTAAASGMGRAGALRFAQEGAAVGVVDLDEAGANAVAKQITDAGGKAHRAGRRPAAGRVRPRDRPPHRQRVRRT